MSRFSFRLALAAVLAAPALAPAQGFGPPAAFNPYTGVGQPAGRPGGVGNLAAFQQSITGAGFNPYTPGLPGAGLGSNLYTPGLSDPSGGGYNPYLPWGGGYGSLYGPYGGTLMGAAEFLKGYGTALTSQEQARIMREQANQARLQTVKNRFDLDMYIKANTPSFTEEQAKINRLMLKRIQTAANPTEVSSGRALNILLDDVAKAPGKKIAMDPVPLSEDVLARVNVRAPGSNGSLGALRDGKIAWPVALQQVLADGQRKAMEAQAHALMQDAGRGKVDANVLRDFGSEVDAALERVIAKANDMPTPQYLEAKRFLGDLGDARAALEGGQATAQAGFHKFIGGGKNVQDVVNYLVDRGLVFAPATAGDEAAYRALYSALVAHNVAFHAGAGESKE